MKRPRLRITTCGGRADCQRTSTDLVRDGWRYFDPDYELRKDHHWRCPNCWALFVHHCDFPGCIETAVFIGVPQHGWHVIGGYEVWCVLHHDDGGVFAGAQCCPLCGGGARGRI